eukprot:Pompholyxophrys_punicea_v1_NODE_268_length_2452_cov_4.625782.p1 type:complete len:104 gc:universal NODE_268_length_2452_cov_4.625782:2054-2365(+)
MGGVGDWDLRHSQQKTKKKKGLKKYLHESLISFFRRMEQRFKGKDSPSQSPYLLWNNLRLIEINFACSRWKSTGLFFQEAKGPYINYLTVIGGVDPPTPAIFG